MTTLLHHYFDTQVDNVVKHIDKIFESDKLTHLTEGIVEGLLEDSKFLAFHEYYLGVTNKPKKALANKQFFANFKKKYSLQGIDNSFLHNLEKDKQKIIDTITSNPEWVYTVYFQNVMLKHKEESVNRNLASFVAKLLHTFNPNQFIALDNPVKNLLGLSNEGFYFSFLVVNSAYIKWLDNNKSALDQMKQTITAIDKTNQLKLDSLTDLKIVDIFLWRMATKKRAAYRKNTIAIDEATSPQHE